jgi:phage/plasmid-like protein (TIGR03299 family)
MAHELYQINGDWSMAFVGDTPWHGLGQELTPGSNLDIWAKEAKLQWEVKAASVSFRINDFKGLNAETKQRMTDEGNEVNFEGRKVLYRSDDGHPLSVVSDRYKPVQPMEILEFYRDLIKNYDFKMETAGSLKHGQRIWALASTGQGGSIMGQDRIGNYLLLATSCDGSLSTTAQFTTIRVVCNNTLTFAYNIMRNKEKEAAEEGKQVSDIVKVPHNAIFNPDAVKIELGLVDNYFKQFMEDATELAKVKVDENKAFDYFMSLFGKTDDDLEDVSETTLRRVFKVYRGGKGQQTESAKGTAWGLVNAITEYYDHDRVAHSQDTRLNAAWFGDGNRMKAKAMNLALDTFVKKAA